ncbi:hypothetical protein NDS46_12620 [Paenibacillus thiaminolyticus]|uniref:hypothetical protein n=1 Tax=Paenibacillus thiaminolyticus TaxID=49283 RepID=UPI00232D0489|nr:hypothetical protein [Paenibacillus thiaminolyticus]WCF10629.1 hypothetical protein NDS46_12620 [Paenibacillus thiaminolyticus]
MSDYPIDIATFHDTILQLQGIAAIESGVENFEPIDGRCCRSPHALICLMPRCGGREKCWKLNTLEPAFGIIRQLNQSLEQAVDLYKIPVK